MNGRKKLLCLLMLAFFLFSYTSINAFAVDGGGATPQKTEQANPTPTPTPTPKPDPTPTPTPKPDPTPAPAPTPTPTPTPKATDNSSSSKAASSKPKPKRHYVAAASSSSSSMSSVPDFFGFSSQSSSSEIVLPSADSVAEFDPLASASSGNPSNKMKQIGILAWVVILLGVAVVLIVILSNRRPPRGPGRSRYHRTKRSKKKRLLNDKYYRGLNRY